MLEQIPSGDSRLNSALRTYYCHAKRVAKGGSLFFQRFVWGWPTGKKKPQRLPTVFSCEAAEYASLSCQCPPELDRDLLEEARSLVRQVRSVAVPNFPGIIKSTMHEIAEAFGDRLGEILRATPAPAYTFDDWEEIMDDYYSCANEEVEAPDWIHPEVLGEDPDSFPMKARRIGPDWMEYQAGVAAIIGRRFRSISQQDFERMAAEVELEYANALKLRQISRPGLNVASGTDQRTGSPAVADTEIDDAKVNTRDKDGESELNQSVGTPSGENDGREVKGKLIDERMKKKLESDPTKYVAWSAQNWAEHLGCSKSTVHGTGTWGQIMTLRKLNEADRASQGDRTPSDRRRFGKNQSKIN